MPCDPTIAGAFEPPAPNGEVAQWIASGTARAFATPPEATLAVMI